MGKPEDTAPLKRGLAPVHPGEMLRLEVVPALKATGVTKVALAAALGISRRTLEDILLEKQNVTPEMALRLGKALGNGPNLWLNLQQDWDLARARERLGAALDEIATFQVAS